jgi:hypothetical protein
MEKRITKKVEQYQHDFKTAIKDYLDQHKCTVVQNNNTITSDFLKFVYDFQNLELSKEDFVKRKRVKNYVPNYERCSGKRANGEQCSRRKKTDECFCGTHIKGTPHGVVEESEKDQQNTMTKIEVWVQEIKGINYYIDNANNVYLPGDILSNNSNPRKIGIWNLTDNGDYNISQC